MNERIEDTIKVSQGNNKGYPNNKPLLNNQIAMAGYSKPKNNPNSSFNSIEDKFMGMNQNQASLRMEK